MAVDPERRLRAGLDLGDGRHAFQSARIDDGAKLGMPQLKVSDREFLDTDLPERIEEPVAARIENDLKRSPAEEQPALVVGDFELPHRLHRVLLSFLAAAVGLEPTTCGLEI